LRLTVFVGHTVLLHALDQVQKEYDYIICDCPPNFNPNTKNALWTSDAYLVPTMPDFLSTYGVGLLQRSVHKLFSLANPVSAFSGPVLAGIVLTRVKATKLHNYYCDQVRFDYPGKVFNHVISDSIAIAGAADERTPVSALNAPKGHTIELQQQFQNTAGEFITRMYHLRSQNVPAMSLLG
jgi:chromosome partitioning protein